MAGMEVMGLTAVETNRRKIEVDQDVRRQNGRGAGIRTMVAGRY
jgi:hypothetical protein